MFDLRVAAPQPTMVSSRTRTRSSPASMKSSTSRRGGNREMSPAPIPNTARGPDPALPTSLDSRPLFIERDEEQECGLRSGGGGVRTHEGPKGP
jgi:hypothetical protein